MQAVREKIRQITTRKRMSNPLSKPGDPGMAELFSHREQQQATPGLGLLCRASNSPLGERQQRKASLERASFQSDAAE
jgi:hypothetical protein